MARVWARATVGGAALCAGVWWGQKQDSPEPAIVVVGGGVMGLATAWKLGEALRGSSGTVELIDTGHAVRGSWGSTRASHLSMEDMVLLKRVNDVLVKVGLGS